MTHHPYLVIEGVIGVGKTTLARYLQEALQAELLLEVFEENPFLSDFYADRERHAFQTETFFLLSRYHQQHAVIPQIIARQPLISDYLFDKSWLFAHLNLINDEWAVYDNLYHTLAERIPPPSQVVYLRASVDTLMERIAIRDRAYERNMPREYIASLHQAYDAFFNDYPQPNLLTIETDPLNIVHDPDARQAVIGQIKQTLAEGAYQPRLPHLKPEPSPLEPAFLKDGPRRLPEYQVFHQALDQAKGFTPELYLNYILLIEEIGELGKEFARMWGQQNALQQNGADPAESLNRVLADHKPHLEGELADCLAYLLKLANYTGIDLETAYINKMLHNLDRTWPKKPGLAHLE